MDEEMEELVDKVVGGARFIAETIVAIPFLFLAAIVLLVILVLRPALAFRVRR